MSRQRFRIQIASWLAVASLAALGRAADAPAAGKGTLDFNRQVLPILADNCFTCHGPDENERKARLRLDRHEDALRPNRSGEAAVVPGDVARSLLVQRVGTSDEDDVMPPRKTGKRLTPGQIEVLTRWVAEGARWDQHWAYVKPERPAVPEVRRRQWPRNEIDSFVLARLEREGLSPSPTADGPTLVRRATLDLTGLPPTPQEVDAFLADQSPAAYEKLVDRLLASPRYGEHQARYWLDAARYADSHGYHIDAERSLWKWRDWVIEAFNANLPFDEFTTEQLAGDLLPEPTTAQRIASGYVRNNMSTGEGGAIEEEYQAKYAFDRVETTATVWTGLTLTCARCHTHKYDPITQREYYQLYAFFNNLDEPVMDGNKPNPDPFLKLPTEEQSRRQAWLKQHIDDGQANLDAPRAELDAAQVAWEARWRSNTLSALRPLTPEKLQSTNGVQFRVLDDRSVLAEGPNPEQDIHELTVRPAPGKLMALRLEAIPDASLPHHAAGRAEDGTFRLSGFEIELQRPPKDDQEPDPERLKLVRAVANSWDGEHDPGRILDDKEETGWSPAKARATEPHAVLFLLGEPVTVPEGAGLRVRLRYQASKSHQVLGRFRLTAVQDEPAVSWLHPPKPPAWRVLGPFNSPGIQEGLAKAYPPEQALDFDQTYPGVREEIKWQSKSEIEDGKAHLLVNELHGVHGVYYLHRVITVPEARKLDLRLRADDVFRLWVNGTMVAERKAKALPGEGALRVGVDLQAGTNAFLVKVVNFQGACHFTFSPDFEDADHLPADLIGLLLTSHPLADEPAKQVRDFFRRVTAPDWKAQADQVALWREENDAIEQAMATTLVAKERGTPRETRLLMRGEYDKPGEKITPGVLAILPPFPPDTPTNRLGLARWLLAPSHPLTARVTVNRIWQQHFGVGLVKTAEDFGIQGERPSHPELLDWLATEFVRSGWDLKAIHRRIVTSATYRQSSRAKPSLVARDPENRLLARGPRFRLDGEVVRDTALAVSGLLVEQRGGRSVKPYEPPGLWEAVSFNNSQKYVQDTGDANYRRSLYTFWKRQSPPPNMLLFDAPTREYCVVRRPRTNTPLQALALLNDPQFVEASRAFAQRILLEGGDTTESRLTFAFRVATARRPERAELRRLARLLEAQRSDFRHDPAAAAQLLAVGPFPRDPKLDPAELAAWTAVANVLLNLDETITKS